MKQANGLMHVSATSLAVHCPGVWVHCPSTTRPAGSSEKDRLRRTVSPCSRTPAVGPRALDSPIVNKCHIYLSSVRVYSTSKLYLYVCIQTCALTYFLNYLKPCFRHPYTSCLNSSACLTQVPVFPQAFSACPSNLILIQSH